MISYWSTKESSWIYTTPELHSAAHTDLSRPLTYRPNGRKLAWVQDPSSHNSPQQEDCSSVQRVRHLGSLAWWFICSTSNPISMWRWLASWIDTGVREMSLPSQKWQAPWFVHKCHKAGYGGEPHHHLAAWRPINSGSKALSGQSSQQDTLRLLLFPSSAATTQ